MTGSSAWKMRKFKSRRFKVVYSDQEEVESIARSPTEV